MKKAPGNVSGGGFGRKFNYNYCLTEIIFRDFEQVVEILATHAFAVSTNPFTFGAWFTGFRIRLGITRARSGMYIPSRTIFW